MRNLTISITLSLLLLTTGRASAQQQFSALEQQKISIETPGLFDQSDAFIIDFNIVRPGEYSFPLPLGKAEKRADNNLEIHTTSGDAVKAMFPGVVRMSWHHPEFGNVVVVRHDNGLETVYGLNAENRVKVGQRVKAGQTIAIVGGKGGRIYCEFAIMVNGARINPEMIIDLKTHKLLEKAIRCRREGYKMKVASLENDPWESERQTVERGKKKTKAGDPFAGSNSFTINFNAVSDKDWCYPLPGAKVISPYGRRGGRMHTGTDLKTVPNDPIYAAFDGEVTMSQPYSGYGKCIIIRHDNGLETLYSHNSKNLVEVGNHVKAGQKIALTGRTGRATTEHLHFEVRVAGRHYNPNILFDHANHQLKKESITFYKNGRQPSVNGKTKSSATKQKTSVKKSKKKSSRRTKSKSKRRRRR